MLSQKPGVPVSFDKVQKSYGAVRVLEELNLQVEPGEFLVLLGASGSGKTTALRILSGLETATEGRVRIGDRDVTDVLPKYRDISMVFQSYALYPHKTVGENIGFPLKVRKVNPVEREVAVREAAAQVQLDTLLHRYPRELSGGQRQRVALARAIIRRPSVFLMDEPLSNLDAKLRGHMRAELKYMQQSLGITTIYVTHDQIEAMTMADKIVVLSAGLIEQVGSPLELYHRPKNLFVAQFIGSPKMNVVPAKVAAVSGDIAHISVDGGSMLALPLRGGKVSVGDVVSLGIRPEHMSVSSEGVMQATVKLAERLGSETMLHLSGPGGAAIIVRSDGLASEKPGDVVALTMPAGCCHLFDAAGIAIVNGALI